ncbi:MAG TPA: prepilin-type N-terminal cleavage/methylation domain-containing protein [Planctomycetota bacterium]|nr:prepilin-type N-terminal cleavage/methylation domain-containing protein [Planctomycetota bacterium]
MQKKGFTLIELIVATAIGGAFLLVLAMTFRASLFSVETTSIQSDLDVKAASVVDLMVKELKDAGGGMYASLTIDPSHQAITFSRCTGYANGAPTYGNPITYALATYGSSVCLERRELVNGAQQSQILCDQLSARVHTVRSAQGIDRGVTGVYFENISASVVMLTVVVEKSNYLLKTTSATTDDLMWAASQASVEIVNN